MTDNGVFTWFNGFMLLLFNLPHSVPGVQECDATGGEQCCYSLVHKPLHLAPDHPAT